MNDESIDTLKFIDNILGLDNIIDDDVFKTICKNKKIISIRYLLEININYDYKRKDDDIIPIIKNSVEYYYENRYYDKLIEYYNISEINIKLSECLICYQNKSNLVTNCNHNYCLDCIFKWYIYNKHNCPYCRQDINLNECKIIC